MIRLGVVIVTYNSQQHILRCIESVLKDTEYCELSIVIIDNGSCDQTVDFICNWWSQRNRQKRRHESKLKLIQSKNNGFAAGVNQGLRHLLRDKVLDRFWILNPDTELGEGTAHALANYDRPFDVLGCRIAYLPSRAVIQLDGGRINPLTGASRSINIGSSTTDTPLPKIETVDYISGASMVVSRDFIERVGLMPEDFFLYYEEVDWVFKDREKCKLALCPDAIVYHAAGASIGSPTLTRAPSELSVYCKHRSRLLFVGRHFRTGLFTAYVYGLAKALQHLKNGQLRLAKTVVTAHCDYLLGRISTSGHLSIQVSQAEI